jgi:4-amino-4-deoxy-L-arabinose transferase-like glycosyltransferase
MARSGDWITPSLWGAPWFEKPPLAYWMTAAATRIGLGGEAAARAPVALMSAAFLWFFHRVLAREFGPRAAWYATAILATCAGWVSFSQIAVTDLPLAATFSAAMLIALPWLNGGPPRGLIAAGALMGLAILAKALAPAALAVPLLWMGRRRWRDLVIPAAVAIAVAAPWFALMTMRHGSAFLNDLFWKHHFQRLASSEAIGHGQPFWFYVPVLAAGLLPWTPLAAALASRAGWSDARQRFLMAWIVFGFVFFSANANKLPGYLLPLFPPIAALAGLRLAAAGRGWPLALCALPLGIIPAIAAVLPDAIADGLGDAPHPSIGLAAPALALALAIVVWRLDRAGRRGVAMAALAVASTAGVAYLKRVAYPALDERASVRPAVRRLALDPSKTCAAGLSRDAWYGLNYYLGVALPACGDEDRPVRLVERDGKIAPAPPG